MDYRDARHADDAMIASQTPHSVSSVMDDVVLGDRSRAVRVGIGLAVHDRAAFRSLDGAVGVDLLDDRDMAVGRIRAVLSPT